MLPVNRQLILIRPKEALVTWVHSILPDFPIAWEDLGKHDSANAYLIPVFEEPEEALAWVKENFEYFLTEELLDWVEEEQYLPKELTQEMFEDFCDCEFHSMVLDTIDYPLEKEEEWWESPEDLN